MIEYKNGYVPRHNAEIEKYVIGSLISNENAPFIVLPLIRNADVFYIEENKIVFKAITELMAQSKSIDLLSVDAYLRKTGKIDHVGGSYYLADCATVFVGDTVLNDYCLILIEHHIARQLVATGTRIANMASDEKADALQLYDDVQKQVDAISEQITLEPTRDWQTILKEITFEIERLGDESAGFTGVRTGFRKLDETTGGWHGGQFIILAARPAMGKTAMAVKHVCDVARAGTPVGVFELEMRDVDFGKRIIANESNLHANQLFVHGLTKGGNDYWPGYWKTISAIEHWPVHISTRPGLTVNDFQIEARKMVQRHGVKFIVIDYLQLMNVGRESRTINNREQEISTISRMIKKTALELNIPIMALSQLSRNVETRSDKRPRLSDLRESGSLEQDADIVLFIHRPEYYMPNDEPTGATEYIIEKHRNGQTGAIDVMFDANRVKFIDDFVNTF